MSDDQASNQGCPLWNTGRYCQAGATTGCPYVHDNFLRKQAIEKKRLGNMKRQKDQKMAASRANLQGKYNNVLTSKTPNAPNASNAKQFASVKVNTAEVNARIESIIKRADTEVQISTPANLDSNLISAMVTKINHLKVELVTITRFETIYHLSWATVTYSKPNTQMASMFPSTNPKVCRLFRTGICHRGNRCGYTHSSPNNTQSPWPGVVEEAFRPELEFFWDMSCMPPMRHLRRACPPPKYSWDVYNRNAGPELQSPKPGDESLLPKQTYAKTASKGIFVPRVSPSKAQHSKTHSQVSSGTSSQGSVNSSDNSWDVPSNSTTNEPQLSDADRWALEIAQPQIVFNLPRNRASASATFHGFSRLPAELRIKIWKMAIKDYKRTVRLAWRWDDEHMGNYYRSRLEPLVPSPPFVQINREARDIGAVYHFSRSFGTMQSGPETWFNFDNDRIFLQTPSAGQLVKMVSQIISRERKLVKGLCLPLRDFVHNPSGFIEVVTSFINLRELCLVASSGAEDRHWTYDPRLTTKVKRAITAQWVRRQNKYRPDDILPLPKVARQLVSPGVAQVFGVDGILWGANVHHEQTAWARH
jgi:2EXR family